MKKFFIFLTSLFLMSIFLIEVSANSAIRNWYPIDNYGICLVSDNPIDVLNEDLTFDLGSEKNNVSAKYKLYNSSDDNIEAELLFPIGRISDCYGSLVYYTPGVFLNDTLLDTKVRLLYTDGLSFVRSLNYLKDDYKTSQYDVKKYYKVTIDDELYKSYKASYINVENATYINDDNYFLSYEKSFYLQANYTSEDPIISIKNDGNIVKYKLEEATKYDFIKYKASKIYGSKIYDYYSEIDIYNLVVDDIYLSSDSVYAVIDYKISIPSKSSVINEVKTNIFPTIDNDYSPEAYTFDYYLEPAQTFNSFKNLKITINIDDTYLISSNLDIKLDKSEKIYELEYETLPNKNIRLTTCQSFNPTYKNKTSWNDFKSVGFGILTFFVCIMLTAAILVPTLIAVKKKLFPKVYLLVVENIIIALALFTIILPIVFDTKYIILSGIILITMAIATRLVGGLTINKKYYSDKTWIFDGVCLVFESLALLMALIAFVNGFYDWYVAVILLIGNVFIFDIPYLFFKKAFYKNKEVEE